MMPATQASERFHVLGGHLVREVIPKRGRPYNHRCPLSAFEQVALAADRLGTEGFTIKLLQDDEAKYGREISWTHIGIAIGFLRDRELLIVQYRRHYSTSRSVHLDAMVEYHALAHAG